MRAWWLSVCLEAVENAAGRFLFIAASILLCMFNFLMIPFISLPCFSSSCPSEAPQRPSTWPHASSALLYLPHISLSIRIGWSVPALCLQVLLPAQVLKNLSMLPSILQLICSLHKFPVSSYLVTSLSTNGKEMTSARHRAQAV